MKKNFVNFFICKWIRTTVITCAMLFFGFAQSAELSFKGKQFRHSAEREALPNLLRSFAASQNWVLSLPEDMEGTISAKFDLTPEEFWNLMMRSNRLTWYFDGQIVHVTSVEDMKTVVMSMTEDIFERLSQSLKKLDIGDMRFPLRYDAVAGSAILTAPPHMIEMVGLIFNGFEQESEPFNNDIVTRVVQLRSAQADDIKVRVGSNEQTIEGVASIVRKVMGIDSTEDNQSPATSNENASKITPIGGRREATPSKDLAQVSQGNTRASTLTKNKGSDKQEGVPVARNSLRGHTGMTQVIADAATNSIIIRGRGRQIQTYIDLIQQLDRPRILVEIEAMIIDLERGALADLGIDWQFNSPNANFNISNSGITGAIETENGSSQTMTAMIGNSVRQMLARVKAMESDGRARVITTPRILTIENSEALIENTETAYIKVAGNLDSNLFSVVTGTSLNIRPAVLSEQIPRRLRLVVGIEDGSFSKDTVDGIPTVKKTNIFTQAELLDGATLVIGGLSVQRQSRGVAGVPGLASVPMLGRLFSYDTSVNNEKDRIYLLTPRISRLGEGQLEKNYQVSRQKIDDFSLKLSPRLSKQ